MATRTKEVIPGKERRGTSPSQIPHRGTTPNRKSPNTSTTTSPARKNDSEKHVPNYLKATRSSGPDTSKQQGKKPVTSNNNAQNPTLIRRRSFDKPPSPSPTQKSRVSLIPTLRSSSFSGKTVPQKQVIEKNLKAPRDVGKQHSLYAKPVKKTVYVKKDETGTSDLKIKEEITGTPENVGSLNLFVSPELEIQVEEQVSSVTEAQKERVILGSDDENNIEVPVLEDKEPINIEQTEVESDKDEEIVIVESPTVLEHQNASLSVEMEEETEEKSQTETGNKQLELKYILSEITNDVNDESVAATTGNPDEEVEEKNGEEETTMNEKEEVSIDSEALGLKEKEIEVAKEEKQELKVETPKQIAAPLKQVAAQGKKDSALSNDVIEETASKLREQRKNRVRALAGAFETVISMQ